MAELGRRDAAAVQLEEAARVNPQALVVQRKLDLVRMAQGQHAVAIEHLQKVLAGQPKDVACWYNLANAYRISGQLKAALGAYRRTLEIQPKMTLAANNLAWLLATHPLAENRNGAEAVRWATVVCEQTNFSHPSFLDTLACAYAEEGDFEKAVTTAAKAIQLLQDKEADSGDVQKRLELFRSAKPYRDESL